MTPALMKEIGHRLWRGWMAFAHLLGIVNTKVLLTIFYVLVIGPTWFVTTLFGVDTLGVRDRRAASFWRRSDRRLDATESSKHPY